MGNAVHLEPVQTSMMLKPHLESMTPIASIDRRSRHRLRINGHGFTGVSSCSFGNFGRLLIEFGRGE